MSHQFTWIYHFQTSNRPFQFEQLTVPNSWRLLDCLLNMFISSSSVDRRYSWRTVKIEYRQLLKVERSNTITLVVLDFFRKKKVCLLSFSILYRVLSYSLLITIKSQQFILYIYNWSESAQDFNVNKHRTSGTLDHFFSLRVIQLYHMHHFVKERDQKKKIWWCHTYH